MWRRVTEATMATDVKYREENVGDWGVPVAAPGGSYSAETLKLDDGVSIFFRSWQAADAAAPVLVLVHGLGAHTGWFVDMGNELNARGLSVYMDDHRGFGRSGGPRGHVRKGPIYLQDATRFLDEIQRRQPTAPLFVLGHSMGGIFTVHLAAGDARSGRNRLAGIILVNPWVRDRGKPSLGTTLQVVGGGMAGSTKPLALAGGPDVMTTNPEAVRMLNADTYWVRAESAAFFYQITQMRTRVLRLAREVRAPALAIQSEKDLAVVAAASRAAYEALGSADKTWKTYPGFAHDFEFEAGRAQLDDDLADWILRHRSR
jgi:alpha-beta hydrolase superfamily lysophospholipase